MKSALLIDEGKILIILLESFFNWVRFRPLFLGAHCCYYKWYLSIIFPTYKAVGFFSCRNHHVVVFYHQLFWFDSHHSSKDLVQKLTRIHLFSNSFIKPSVVKSLTNILEANSIGSEDLINKLIILALVLNIRC